MQSTPSKSPVSLERIQGLHLPNCHNCIQAALFQLSQGNQAQAIAFLESAQASLIKAGLIRQG